MNINLLDFIAYGTPTPQAGTRAVDTAKGKRQISTGGKGLAGWRQTMTAAAIDAAHGGRIPGAIRIEATFRRAMPASRPRAARESPYPQPCLVKPDIDKLERALLDSLTAAGVIDDDARVWQTNITKVEVWQAWTGVHAIIRGANA